MSDLYSINTDLSRGDLGIYVKNAHGQSLDSLSIFYTVYNSNLQKVSGKNLPAINYCDGYYYAPWRTSIPGAFRIEWVISGYSKIYTINFYVQQNGLFALNNGQILNTSAIPPTSSKTFLVGYTTANDDLTLYTKDEFCQLVDVENVRWSIQRPDGCIILKDLLAIRTGVGSYFASWKVFGQSGTYNIIWSYLDPRTGISYSPQMPFNVLCPQPVANVSNPGHQCGCTCSPACYPGLCGYYPSCSNTCCG